MEVQSVIAHTGKTRFIIVDDNGELVISAVKYLKFLDNSGKAKNTLRRYAYDLRLFFEFLEQKKMNYDDMNIDSMAEFLRWLQNPYQDVKVTPFAANESNKTKEKKRTNQTINDVISTVLRFFDYVMKNEDLNQSLSEKFRTQISGSKGQFKNFLYHISKKKFKSTNTLRLKVPKKGPKVLTDAEVQTLFNACTNIRDKFLLFLLYETGMRIGEALSLHLSDIVPGTKKIKIEDRGESINGAEIKTVGSVRTLDCTQDLINLYSSYILEYHTDEVDTNFVFIKLSGENKYEPMEYTTVEGLFDALKRKTGINVTPHMFRHTCLTKLRRAGMRAETLQKRAGHKHVQTTLNTYVTVTEEDVREDWENNRDK